MEGNAADEARESIFAPVDHDATQGTRRQLIFPPRTKVSKEGSLIIPFFEKQTVLFTGATGLLGKVLLWKLMNHCNVKKIFVLIRDKHELSARDRFDKEVLQSPLFKVHAELRHQDRIHVVGGDLEENGLGLSAEDRQMLINEVTVVIHGAATTKFTEHIKTAIKINVLGVKHVLKLAHECNNIVSFVHVSTAYVNFPLKNSEVREAVYSKSFDVSAITRRILQMSDEEAEEKTPSIIPPFPNTYAYTKNLGESIVLQDAGIGASGRNERSFPICIVRPSIIVPALREPVAGWVDSMIGPSGLSLAGGLGFLRFMRADPNFIVDFIPVDYVASAIIAAAWRNTRHAPSTNPPASAPSPTHSPTTFRPTHTTPTTTNGVAIYHVCTSATNPTTWYSLNKFVGTYTRFYRSKYAVGPRPWNIMSSNHLLSVVCHFLFHLVPAALMDVKLVMQRKKRKMLKVAQRLHNVVESLSHFTLNYWLFHVDNLEEMRREMTEEDQIIFRIDVAGIHWPIYYMIYTLGLSRFLLKEEPHLTTKEAGHPITRAAL